jgi:hypothetical protein
MGDELRQIEKIIRDESAPVVIVIDEYNTRVVAEIFEHARGIVFADVGFCHPMQSGHPFHIVEGELTGDNPWKIGSAIIRVALPDEDQYDEWKRWLDAKKRYGCTRELAREGIENDFGFK